MVLKHVVKAALLVSSLIIVQGAHAATLVPCPSSFISGADAKVVNGNAITGYTTAASACQYLSPANQDNPATVANIKTAGFFNYTDWVENAGNVQRNANGKQGTWSISNVDFAANDYMIVFKSGENTNLIGFLLNEQFASGQWFTPFTPAAFNVENARDVSHYTIVQRANVLPPPPVDVPEPGILGLLAAGLAGFGVARRRSLKK